LPLLETDLYEVMTACCDGTLESVDVRFKEGTSAATVVCAAKGYPEKYPKGMPIEGLDEANNIEGVKVYHAGTKLEDGVTRCSGGRVLAVTGLGSNLRFALRSAYRGVSKLNFIGPNGEHLMHNRTDIAKGATNKKMRVGVLGSTRGTALLPVIEACANGALHAEIVAVVSNKRSAPILDKGHALGNTVTTKFVSSKDLSREQFDAECTSVLLGAGVELVLLVGYMRILSKPFTDFWAGKCLNVHPSLLPKHAGGMDLAVHQAVIDAKEDESGCTIHQVTEAVDGGPIVVQKRVTVEEGDTAESLKAKVQPLEGPAFIEAINILSQGGVVSYADAGVCIDAGNELVDLIKPACKATRRPGCDADLGGFGGLFDLAAAGYEAADTVLIGATDGVGTKLRIAQATKKHDFVGIDLVAMCVNDLIVAGGEPLFFLDYYATGHLHVDEAAAVVRGIAEGCKQAGCGLIGGETAEMPSMYAPGDYDLAGFAVGAVLRDQILPKNIAEGDILLGLPSSGIHSNGFSLVRKLIEKEGLEFGSPCPWDDSPTIGESLLTPTKIYVKSCLPLLKKGLLKGLAHITGGGLLENLPRSLPSGVGALVTGHPALPPVFKWMQTASGLDDHEMLRTFNCGVGMVLIVSSDKCEEAKQLLTENGASTVFELGCLVEGEGVAVSDPL
jgi:formyltetrahydrofolate-dependent phosphoribosylglycinamide formyltransferase